MNSELHLIIVWHNANENFSDILNDISNRFSIKEVYEITWNKENIVKNFIAFYSHSQSHLNWRKINKLMRGKSKYCGKGPFHLIIFEDNNPIYEKRITSSGKNEVNINIFDCKQKYRKITGGGHLIHGTDSEKESSKDLTLLLGQNKGDFLANNNICWNGKIKKIIRDISGVTGFDSLEQFFYVLNSSLDYIIMRNFEGFPEEYTSSEHGDIDLLVDNLKLAVYTTGAKKVYKRNNRVHYKILIANSELYFDFRYLGDNYYDLKWEKQLLEERVLLKNSFYIPDKNNYFYSLLYHAIVHKPKFSDDYIEKLVNIGESLGLLIRNEFDYSQNRLRILNEFMDKKKYQFVYPNDLSVYTNLKINKFVRKAPFVRRINCLKVHFRILLSLYLKNNK